MFTYMYVYIHTYKHTYIPTYLPLHYITLHYTTLHYTTLHYITYIHTSTIEIYHPENSPWSPSLRASGASHRCNGRGLNQTLRKSRG